MQEGLGPDPTPLLEVWWWTPSRLPDLTFDPDTLPDLAFEVQLVELREASRTQCASCLLITHPSKETGADLWAESGLWALGRFSLT